MYKYCVCNVWLNGGEAHVRYYAFREGQYGLHLVEDIEDKDILWYSSAAEAKEHIWNTNECVISKYFEEEICTTL